MPDILLARPHPFIVSQVKPFLSAAQLTYAAAENEDDLKRLGKTARAAVVSLALQSALPLSAKEVVDKLRAASPDLPLVFASLLTHDQAKSQIRRLLPDADNNYLYFSKTDLDTPEGQQKLTRALRNIMK
ncbi:hypothetical protein CWE09_13880 [Aliidiomarina minuta]|uniref:Uncharacterized protein n=1 Tax=Aliidiomarina minuta TaxID=880057 RepID=A0A432W1C0_9GAMM|nr:hypothetical protein [Aliidiomarina minuta]RUO23015.1 hypothetical protein CWE09_13880 [Aliidiomarina minuta]